jgi:phosphatidylglycerol:prolipoprotein diacylglycerol transferase
VIPYSPIAQLSLVSFQISVWGLFFAAALTAALLVALHRKNQVPLTKNQVYDLAFFLALAGIIGARLSFVIDNWAIYRANPTEIFAIWHGGLGSLGGLVLGIWTAVTIAKMWGKDVWKLLDFLVIPFFTAYVIGRIGNFVTGTHTGAVASKEYAWAVSQEGAIRHPIALYFALYGSAIGGISYWIEKRLKKPGTLFLFSSLLYTIFRFTADFFVQAPRSGGLTSEQTLMIPLAVGLALLLYLRTKSR